MEETVQYLRDHPQHRGGVGFYHKTPEDTDRGFFALSGARLNPSNASDPTGQWVRCDSAHYGPYGYHRWDEELGICNCGRSDTPDPSFGHHEIVLSNVDFVSSVISLLPFGYILYFDLKNEEDEQTCLTQRHSDCAKTLQEVFKLMLEWDFAYTELGNRELVAESCHGMVISLEIPNDIKNWLLSELPDEKVAKFIKGDPNANEPALRSAVPDLTDEFNTWVCGKILNAKPIGAYK